MEKKGELASKEDSYSIAQEENSEVEKKEALNELHGEYIKIQ